jgi:hypothetical protein
MLSSKYRMTLIAVCLAPQRRRVHMPAITLSAALCVRRPTLERRIQTPSRPRAASPDPETQRFRMCGRLDNREMT